MIGFGNQDRWLQYREKTVQIWWVTQGNKAGCSVVKSLSFEIKPTDKVSIPASGSYNYIILGNLLSFSKHSSLK